MAIFIAPHSGFCFGVRTAIQKGEELIKEGLGPVATLGPLIHNPQEVDRLSRMGIISRESFQDIVENKVLIRTHGVAPEVYAECKRRGLEILDCTCPFVRKVQKIAHERSLNGDLVLILGNKAHPEVMGILGWAGENSIAFTEIDELDLNQLKGKNVSLVSQTTENVARFEKAAQVLKESAGHLEVYNTICSATQERQNDALDLAKKVDIMIVIGGKNSANTQKLVSLCEKQTKTYHVESAQDLTPQMYNAVKIGITAGASTPDWIIREVIDKMNEELMTMEECLEQEGASIKPVELHEIVTGVVVKVNNDEVLVDIGGKSEGVIPNKELGNDEVNVGDEVQVMVIRMENKEGNMVLSKKRVDQQLAINKLAEDFEKGNIIEAKVSEAVKGGVIVNIGVRGFVPASLLDTKYIEDINSFVGQTLKFKIVEYKPEDRKVILSRRAVVEEEEKALKEKFWSEIEEGQTIKGTVRRLSNFGAFIDLGGVDGLLHISEMGWGRVRRAGDVVKVGEEVEVYVLSVDKENQKISLSLKKLIPNPWEDAAEKFAVGNIVTGKVVRIASFGAFVELADGVDGLVHISQISWSRVEKVEDALTIGQEVQAKVLDLDLENKKISLSIKETTERPQRTVAEKIASKVEEVADKVEDAMDKIEDKVEDVVDAIKEAIDRD